MGAHPFRIQSTPNGSAGSIYNDGITNNDVSNGTLLWDVQFDSPRVLYYQCTAHANMGGVIYIDNANTGSAGGGGSTNIVPLNKSAQTSIKLNAATSSYLTSVPSGTISSSVQLPSGIVSSSAQITH